jgi:hypothetical protein
MTEENSGAVGTEWGRYMRDMTWRRPRRISRSDLESRSFLRAGRLDVGVGRAERDEAVAAASRVRSLADDG